ncbi:hypothetical protein ACFMBG_19545 [Leisingera sp. D0M16]|uniref:hypothetical protein n=1 Tax=Leisingera coralii TaxID=3351347 RepID=UPI003B7C6919
MSRLKTIPAAVPEERPAALLSLAEKVLCDIDGCREPRNSCGNTGTGFSLSPTTPPAPATAGLPGWRPWDYASKQKWNVLAGEVALHFVREQFGKARTFALASQQNEDEAERIGLQLFE